MDEKGLQGEFTIEAIDNTDKNTNVKEHSAFENEYYECKSSKSSSFFAWLETILTSVAVAFFIITVILRLTEVVGISMEPTLQDGDKLVVYQLFYKPQYNDIIAVKAESLPNSITGEQGEYIVKRVIGLAGDVMSVDGETGTVYRNGQALVEDYISEPIKAYYTGNLANTITVPENSVFVLGDNRNNSIDSRYTDNTYCNYYVGCISNDFILGKVILRIWPFERFGVF